MPMAFALWSTTRVRRVDPRPLAGAMALGLLLLFRARQPAWLESTGRAIWGRARAWVGRGQTAAPLVIGTVWSLLPCGLLYLCAMS